MPLTSKGTKIKSAMEENYGKEKGEEVFYASKNKGTITGVDQGPLPSSMPSASIPSNAGPTGAPPMDVPTTSMPTSGAAGSPPVTGDEDETMHKGPKGVLHPVGEMPEDKPIKQETGGGPSGVPDKAGQRRLAQHRPPDKAVGTLRDYAAAAGAKR
jgi:hypothetical protein